MADKVMKLKLGDRLIYIGDEMSDVWEHFNEEGQDMIYDRIVCKFVRYESRDR